MNTLRGLKTAAAAVLLALLWLLAPSAATAHDQLIESMPADGDVLTEIPVQLSLEFSDEIIPMSPAVLIQDAARTTVFEAIPELNGRVATTAFPELPDGAYSLNWSVVSSDGHRIEGAIPFELATGIAPDPAVAAAAETGDSADSAVSPAEEADDAEGTGGGLAALPLPVKIVLMVAAIGALASVIILQFRRKRPTIPPNGSESS